METVDREQSSSNGVEKRSSKRSSSKSEWPSKAVIKEEHAFAEFKERIQDIQNPEHDDYYLRKWLIARRYDVSKAEQMYRNSLLYKEKMGVNKLLQEYEAPEVLEKYYAGGFCGHDKEGGLVTVELFGRLDMKGLMYSCRKSELEIYKLHHCESIEEDLRQQSKLLERRVDGITVLFDMEHVGTRHFWKPWLQMYTHLLKVLEDNYPEMVKRLLVVNAPSIFPFLWKLGRPLVSEDMRKKIYILGKDYQQTILQYVDAEEVPAYLGGTLTNPPGDPRCSGLINQGGDVPESYYLTEHVGEDEMDKSVVNRGDKLKVECVVEQPGSMLRWEFRAQDYDIAFGVVLLRGKKEVEVVPVKRLNAQHMTQDDSIMCEEAGTYIVIFDNSYSWSRSKTVHYMVELHTPDPINISDVDELSTGGSWTKLSKDLQITHL